MNRQSTHERFWSKVRKGEPDECWVWCAGRNVGGYGLFSVNGRNVVAHRWSYEQAKGPILEHFVIDHLCSNRPCVNPAHLEAVTDEVNVGRSKFSVTGRGTASGPDNRSMRKDIRFRPAEFTAIFRAAKKAQVPMSTWIRQQAMLAAGIQPRDPREF